MAHVDVFFCLLVCVKVIFGSAQCPSETFEYWPMENRCYFFSNTAATFSVYPINCLYTAYSSPLEIHGQEIHFIRNIVKTGNRSFWLGLNRTEHGYRWLSGGVPDYKMPDHDQIWDPNSDPSNRNCVVIIPNGLLAHRPCDWEFPFICEVAGKPLTSITGHLTTDTWDNTRTNGTYYTDIRNTTYTDMPGNTTYTDITGEEAQSMTPGPSPNNATSSVSYIEQNETIDTDHSDTVLTSTYPKTSYENSLLPNSSSSALDIDGEAKMENTKKGLTRSTLFWALLLTIGVFVVVYVSTVCCLVTKIRRLRGLLLVKQFAHEEKYSSGVYADRTLGPSTGRRLPDAPPTVSTLNHQAASANTAAANDDDAETYAYIEDAERKDIVNTMNSKMSSSPEKSPMLENDYAEPVNKLQRNGGRSIRAKQEVTRQASGNEKSIDVSAEPTMQNINPIQQAPTVQPVATSTAVNIQLTITNEMLAMLPLQNMAPALPSVDPGGQPALTSNGVEDQADDEVVLHENTIYSMEDDAEDEAVLQENSIYEH